MIMYFVLVVAIVLIYEVNRLGLGVDESCFWQFMKRERSSRLCCGGGGEVNTNSDVL